MLGAGRHLGGRSPSAMSSESRPSYSGEQLLLSLERAFAQHAGADGVIDLQDLRRSLGLKSEYLVRRVLAAFDLDADGLIQKVEFLAGVRRLVFGSDRDKLWFAFRAHDRNDDGFLDVEELEWMIAIALAENEVAQKASQPPDRLANALFLKADNDRDGKISFEELSQVLASRPQLLQQMVRTEAAWITPNEDLLLYLDRRKRLAPTSIVRFWENQRSQTVVIALWLLANLAVFSLWLALASARNTAFLVGLGRALAACLDFNGALILLPVMRRLLTKVRATWVGRLLPVDDAITFHKIVGHAMFGLAVAHSAVFIAAYSAAHPQPGLARLFTTLTGATGAVLLVVFLVMWGFALGPVRRRNRFELFYFSHLLYGVWLVLLVVHGPRFLLWGGVSLVAFLVEQVVRRRRRGGATQIIACEAKRSGVTRIEIARPAGFQFQAGDYLFLRVPWIARREWHPFTISSAPEAANITLHVRSLGNWTAALRARADQHHARGHAGPWEAYIDGPYGSPSAHIFESKHVVLIGAGIGVTPFASILESLVLRADRKQLGPISKVHFFWLNRDQYSFEWFAALLREIELADRRAFLDIHLCMTAGRTGITSLGLEIARDIMHAAGRTDIVTGLRTHTHMGQPDWNLWLGNIRDAHAPEVVDVYFCGPPGLAAKLAPLCETLGMTFRQEQF